jgi:hypothetical protein
VHNGADVNREQGGTVRLAILRGLLGSFVCVLALIATQLVLLFRLPRAPVADVQGMRLFDWSIEEAGRTSSFVYVRVYFLPGAVLVIGAGIVLSAASIGWRRWRRRLHRRPPVN